MQGLMRRQQLIKFVQAGLECSVYFSPRDPGLTLEELFEIGKRVGYENGEISDVLPGIAAHAHFGDTKIKPGKSVAWSQFLLLEDPDFRNVAAFDFVSSELLELARKQGVQCASIE